MRSNTTLRVLLALTLALVVVAFATVAVPAKAHAQTLSLAHSQNTCSAWMTPHEESGWPWEQERHYLEVPFPVNGTYTVINMYDNQSYPWQEWGSNYSPGNHSRFG